MNRLRRNNLRSKKDRKQRPQSQEGLRFIEFDATKCLPQTQSVLFNTFPGEIRGLIFHYALCDYEDKSDLYDEQTCYRRPGYFAPRRCDTALLRTCQQIYREAWFLPWTTREHTIFLTAPDRCPIRTTSVREMRPILDQINAIHGKTEINNIRVFPQLYRLEPGDDLQEINDIDHFHPRRFTICLRHTDWWYWESDTPLSINSEFVNKCRFPDSVQELCFELESVERRKDQINSIAKQMMEKWQFERKDGVILSAKESPIPVMRWSGSSTWGNERWVRDETRPETIDYYVATIVFRPIFNTTKAPGYYAPRLEVTNFTRLSPIYASIKTDRLSKAKVPPGTPAVEAVSMVQSFSLTIDGLIDAAQHLALDP
ncbi:hypothetical protein F5884DRAFT_748749 [Xylogone sp. PMI_703]|nr:hypothetical protein F5884DRAFT_748749 [Xylogone sp. PMI_703]